MGGINQKEEKIFYLYNVKKLKPIEIASRLRISKQSVNYYLKKLNLKAQKKLNDFYGGTVAISKKRTTEKLQKRWRFHGLHFIITPYYLYPRYEKIRKQRGNYGIQHEQFTIILYNDKVRIQSREGTGWHDTDRYKAIQKAEHDFNQFLNYAAKIYGFEFFKEGRVSIKLVASELAQEDSQIAQDYNSVSQENTLTVKGKDGKVWFVIDQSTGVSEHEYIGANTFSNADKVEPYLNDFLYNRPLTNSQLASRLNDTITAIDKIKDILEKVVK